MTDRELSFLKEHFEGQALSDAIKRVEDGEPLAYVIGEWYFWDEVFKLNSSCLIPRADTEHLVEHALKRIKQGQSIADLCCGSGCIGLTLLKHSVNTKCVFVDISSKALEMAKLNAKRMGLLQRCEFIEADILSRDLFEKESFDVILSNPPYIKSDVVPTLDTVKAEPVIALDGGADGLDFYRVLTTKYLSALKKDGYMILEIGYDQEEQIKELCSCQVFPDYGGNPRVAVIG